MVPTIPTNSIELPTEVPTKPRKLNYTKSRTEKELPKAYFTFRKKKIYLPRHPALHPKTGDVNIITRVRRNFTNLVLQHPNAEPETMKVLIHSSLELPIHILENSAKNQENGFDMWLIEHAAKKYAATHRAKLSKNYLRKFMPTAKLFAEFGLLRPPPDTD
ncbi:MAG: hypothetical protein MI975_09715 [Cytophagales bacterium]|nr:hypothetical protein [Cytophagales bacterium]